MMVATIAILVMLSMQSLVVMQKLYVQKIHEMSES